MITQTNVKSNVCLKNTDIMMAGSVLNIVVIGMCVVVLQISVDVVKMAGGVESFVVGIKQEYRTLMCQVMGDESEVSLTVQY